MKKWKWYFLMPENWKHHTYIYKENRDQILNNCKNKDIPRIPFQSLFRIRDFFYFPKDHGRLCTVN